MAVKTWNTPRKKYNNKKITIGDTTYDSIAEAKAIEGLRLLERAGEITNLQLQPKFSLHANGKKIGTYRADASYIDKNGSPHVIDVKGMDTPLSRRSRKHTEAEYGIKIEVWHTGKLRNRKQKTTKGELWT